MYVKEPLYKRSRLSLEEKQEMWRLSQKGLSGEKIAMQMLTSKVSKICRGRSTINKLLRKWRLEGKDPY